MKMTFLRKILATICLCMLCACVLTACHWKKKAENTLSPQELPLPATIRCGAFAGDSLPLLPEGMQNQIYPFLKRVLGSGCTLKAAMPESWQLEGCYPSPSPDYDLWLVSDPKEGVYKVLLVVAASAVPDAEREVISALVTAYNYAIEQPGKIESEEWYAELDKTWEVRIHKKYELIHSLADTSAAAQGGKEAETVDSYYLDVESGQFMYMEPEYTEAYRAVIQFSDTNRVPVASDTAWLENLIRMQEALEGENIYFMEVYGDFHQVAVTNYMGETVDVVDVSELLKNHSRGYIILEKGKKPRFLRYCPASEALEKMFALWGIVNCDA